MKIPNQGKYDRLVILIKQLILFSWQLIEYNLQISINAENSGHLNFPKYFDEYVEIGRNHKIDRKRSLSQPKVS